MIPSAVWVYEKKGIACGREIEKKDTIGINKKLLGTDTEDYYCIDCLSEYLECTRTDLEIKIQEFKEQGCTLFL